MAVPDILRKRLRLPVISSPMFIVSGPLVVVMQGRGALQPSAQDRRGPRIERWKRTDQVLILRDLVLVCHRGAGMSERLTAP